MDTNQKPPPERQVPLVWASSLESARESVHGRGPAGEKAFVYIIVAAVVVFILVAVGWFSSRAVTTYADAANAAQACYESGKLHAQDALIFRLTFARAQDATLVKGGALLLSFLVVILGVLMVLEGSKAFYKLNVEGAGRKSALETSSPGLVMITLGLTLVYGVMMYKTEFNVSPSSPPQPLAADEAMAVQLAPTVNPGKQPAPAALTPIPEKTSSAPEKKQATALAPEKTLASPALAARLPEVRLPNVPMTQGVPESRMSVQIASLRDAPSAREAAAPPGLSALSSGLDAAQQGMPGGLGKSLKLGANVPLLSPAPPLVVGASGN